MRNRLSIDWSMQGVDLDSIDLELPFEGLAIEISNVQVTNERHGFQVRCVLLFLTDTCILRASFVDSTWIRMLESQDRDDRMIAYTSLIIKCIEQDKATLEMYAKKYLVSV